MARISTPLTLINKLKKEINYMYGISNSQQQGGGGGVSSELVTTLKGTEIIKTFDNLDGCELTKGATADGYIYC